MNVAHSLIRAIPLLASMIFSGAASAEWFTNIQDDIFSGGKKAMLVGAISPYQALVFDCDSESLTLAIISKEKWADGMEKVNTKILVKVDEGGVHELSAINSKRNTEYNQSMAAEKAVVLSILTDIRDAQSNIQLGLSMPEIGGKWSGVISPAGSTREANRFIEACKLQ